MACPTVSLSGGLRARSNNQKQPPAPHRCTFHTRGAKAERVRVKSIVAEPETLERTPREGLGKPRLQLTGADSNQMGAATAGKKKYVPNGMTKHFGKVGVCSRPHTTGYSPVSVIGGATVCVDAFHGSAFASCSSFVIFQ